MEKQSGMSLLMAIVFLILLISALGIGIKLFPAYVDNYYVENILTRIAHQYSNQDGASAQINKDEIIEKINNELAVNNIKFLNHDDISVNFDQQEAVIEIKYDLVIPAVANVDFLVHFDDQASIKSQ